MANGTHDKVQELQTKLYQAAKRSPTRRFHALYDKVHRWDFLCKAWVDVASNYGAPGVDGVSIAQIEEGGDEGIRAFLEDLASELEDGTYRPAPVRRVTIPKAQSVTSLPPVNHSSVQENKIVPASPHFATLSTCQPSISACSSCE